VGSIPSVLPKERQLHGPKHQSSRSESLVPQPSTEADPWDDGYLHVTHSNWATPWASWAQKGFREIGIPDIDDFDSGHLLGSQYCPCTIRPGDQTRATSESTFLQKAMQSDEKNLKVFTHTLANQVLFDGNKTATGVVVETGGFNYTLSANKEVILSAGAVSPNSESDSNSGVLVLINCITSSNRHSCSWSPASDPKKLSANTTSLSYPQDLVSAKTCGITSSLAWSTRPICQRKLSSKTRPPLPGTRLSILRMRLVSWPARTLTTSVSLQLSVSRHRLTLCTGWEKLPAENRQDLTSTALADLAEFPPDWPELEYVVGSYSISPKLSKSKNYVSIFAALITPLSRGNVSIASSSMKDPPLIDVGWLTNSTDLEVLVQGLKRTRALFESSAVRPVLVGEEVLPGKDVVTDEQMAEYIRSVITTVYHASCTCKLLRFGMFCLFAGLMLILFLSLAGKMGKSSDPMAVIDSKARVLGVQGLRVVDASAFPLLVPGHPQSTIYALAEKIADDIMRNA
jgi:choline dehydrogenase